jgi:hypothetical protein
MFTIHISSLVSVFHKIWRQEFRTKATIYVRFEVLTTVIKMITVFCDVMQCSLGEIYRRLRRACHFHLRGRKVSLLLDPEDGGGMLFRNVGKYQADYPESHSR